LARPSSAVIVASVGSPAGSMTQKMRGLSSLAATSSSEATATAPSCASFSPASALRSKATTSCPPRINRRAMLAPMRPSPMIAIRIGINSL